MAGLQDIVANKSEFDALSSDAKQKVFDTLSSQDEEYSALSDDAKSKVKATLVGDVAEKPKVSMDLGEKIANLIFPLEQTKQDLANSPEGSIEKSLSNITNKSKFVGQVGNSIMLANAAGAVTSELPWLMKIKQATGLTPASFAQRASVVAQNISRGAQSLAIQGAAGAQAFDYTNLQDRLTKTAGAAAGAVLIGGAVNAAVEGAASTGRTITKIANTIKDPRIPVINRIKDAINGLSEKVAGTGTAIGKQVSNASAVGREAESAINSRVSDIVDSVQEGIKTQTQQVRQSLKTTTRQVNQAVDKLDTQLANESDIAAKTFQDKIGGFFRRNSSAYGKELDAVSDSVAQHGQLTRGEALDVLTRTLQRSASEAEITSGSVLDQIKQIVDAKYAERSIDAAGNIIVRDLSEKIPFKEFLKDSRSIWKSIKPYTSGARFSADEIPAAILQSEFGEFVAGLPGGEGFKSLQTAYRPVISYMNKANSLIQPMKGEAYRATAQSLVKRYAEGNANGAEKDLVGFLENGTKRFGEGIGNVTAKARQIADNAKVLKEMLAQNGLEAERRLFDIAEQGAMKISKIKAMGESASESVQAETQKRVAMILEEGARQEMLAMKRIQSLGNRQKEVEKLLTKRATIRAVSTGVGLLLSGIAGAYGVYRSSSGISKLETAPNPG